MSEPNAAVRRQTSRKRDFAGEAELDFYPTPPWATRVLLDYIEIGEKYVWEPAAGAGDMAKVFYAYYPKKIIATDINPRAKGIARLDFLSPLEVEPFLAKSELFHWKSKGCWIVTNPPYALLLDFMKRAWKLLGTNCNEGGGMAFFCRIQALEGMERGEFFQKHRPTRIVVFSERVQGIAPQGFDFSKSSMAAYCWIIWQRDARWDIDTRVSWVRPDQKKGLERRWDYKVGFEQVREEYEQETCPTCQQKIPLPEEPDLEKLFKDE